MTKIDYLKEFPQDREYFMLANLTLCRQLETDDSKFVKCEICGKKLARIDGSHLAKHNMTLSEYKSRFSTRTISAELHKKLLHGNN